VVEINGGRVASRHSPMITRRAGEPQKRETPLAKSAIADGKKGPV
jgi:hypothetical protein